MSDTGEKVLWSNLERVDLGDMDAVSDLGQANLAKSFAPLLDNYSGDEVSPPARGGLLSALSYDGTNPAQVSFGPMTIYYAPNGPGGAADHGPAATFRYDRNQAHQANTSTAVLNFTGKVRPFVWARRIPTTTDEEPRRFWDEVNEVEFTDVVFTRERDIVELALSHTSGDNDPPNYGSGWVRIARVVSIGATVVLSPRHAFDGYDATYEASSTNEDRGKGARFYPEEPVVDTTRRPGLPELTRYLIAALCKIQDGQWDFDENSRLGSNPIAGLRSWRYGLLDTAFRGLRQLQGEVDVLTPLTTAPRVLYTAYCSWNGSLWEIVDQVGVDSMTAVSAASAWGTGHRATLALQNVPASWTIFGFTVTPYLGAGFSAPPAGGADLPWTVMSGSVESLPFTGDGSAEFNIQAGFGALASGNANEYTLGHPNFTLIVYGKRA